MTALKDCHVLVTATSFGKDDISQRERLEALVGRVDYNLFGRPLTSQELQETIENVDGLIAGLDQIDREVISRAKKLKVIARYGVGYDRVDLKAAQEKGVIVTYTPGANAVSVAELTIGLILSLARNIPNASTLTKNGQWPRFSGISLAGKTVGILGLGSIGKAVAVRLLSFDCKLIAYDPFPDMTFVHKYHINIVELNNLLRESDFVSLHLPITNETMRMVNHDFIMKMKRGSFFINTARGELVDEGALVQFLQNGHLRGAGIDTFSQEPPDPNNPLFKLDNVIVTPHTGAHSDSATIAMGEMAMNDCLAVMQGKPPSFPVPAR